MNTPLTLALFKCRCSDGSFCIVKLAIGFIGWLNCATRKDLVCVFPDAEFSQGLRGSSVILFHMFFVNPFACLWHASFTVS